ncbi:hypothetical protein [Marinivivus vitaminiproducens]|uniref:hypothetical protein n=1 Tax=Marinivivus vitaminiproducens TaxID=3035935 RepID=UPI00279DB110|nr:MarR family winged helix-turn-helix transcriptional regulator [Geminicoccaceae bacterium SCSIO 64248]
MTAEDKVVLERLSDALDVFVAEHEKASLRALSTMLAVALSDGISQVELAKATGQESSAVNRQVNEYGPYPRNGQPFRNWYHVQPDPTNRNRSLITLTRKGQSLVAKALGILDGQPEAANVYKLPLPS